jgi:hypothetical protein
MNFCFVSARMLHLHLAKKKKVSLSASVLVRRRDRDGGNNQNLILFIRGYAMSGAPSINGTVTFI